MSFADRVRVSRPRRLRGRVGYAGWGLADQAMSSLSNFGVGLVAVRSSSSEEFGAFSVAFATAVLGIGIVRALVSDVYSVRFAGMGARPLSGAAFDPDLGADADAEVERMEVSEILGESGREEPDAGLPDGGPAPVRRYPHAAGAWGSALGLGLVTAAACLVAGLLSSGPLRTSMLVLAAGMPFLVLQDVVRFVCIARRDPFGATISDATWVIVFALLVAGAVVTTGTSPDASVALGMWLVGAACGAAVGAVRMEVVPRLTEGIAFVRLVWRQSVRYLIDWVALGASAQVGLYVLGATAGLAVLGDTRTALLLIGPINIVTMGATMVLVPALTRYRLRSGSRLLVAAAAISVLLECFSLAWLGAVWLLPESILQAILGDAAASARSDLAALVVMTSTVMIAQGSVVALRATGDIRRGTHASVPSAPFMLLGPALGAVVLGGSSGALVGLALGFGVSGVLSVVQLVLATRSAPIAFDQDLISSGNH